MFALAMSETIFYSVGASNTGYGVDDSEDKLNLMTQAMSNLAGATADLDVKILVDHNWKNNSRVSCQNFFSSEILDSQVEDLEEFRDYFQQRMVETISELLGTFGRSEEMVVIETETLTYYQMACDTLTNDIAWHRFIQSVVVTHDFAEVLILIQNVSTKLVSFRQMFPFKVQCLARTYTYLRDLKNDDWITRKIQGKIMNKIMAAKLTTQPSDKSNWITPFGNCGVIFHLGGAKNCPWKAKSKAEANIAAVLAARSIGR